MVRLGVKPGPLGVVGDPHLHVGEPSQPLHGRGIGRPHVGGGDESHRHLPVAQVLEGRYQQPQARPLDERNENINAIGGAHLGQQFMGQLWFLGRAGEETAFGQRCVRAGNARPAIMGRGDFEENRLLIRYQPMFVKVASARFVGNVPEDMIAEGEAPIRVGFFPQGLFKHLGHKGSVLGGLFFRINFSKNSPQIRSQGQCIAEKFIDECFIYAGAAGISPILYHMAIAPIYGIMPLLTRQTLV